MAALGFGMVPFQPIAQTFDTALVVNAEGATEETVTAYDGRTIPMSDVIAINGGRYYDNLLYAVFWAKDGDTITLLKDYTTDTSDDYYNNYMYLDSGSNVTVDLNGHTLTIDGWYWVMQYSTENPGSVKFINGNIEGGCIVPDENAIITIGDGATVKSVDEVTIYWSQDGTLNITGGYLEGPTVVYARTGEVNISGGKLVVTGEKNEAGGVANGTNPTGDAVVFQAFGSSYGTPTNVSITGGEFVSENGNSVATYERTENDTAPDNFVTGGTFTSGGEADTSVAEYFADSEDNAMLATGEVISKEEYAENGYSVEIDAETGIATPTINGTLIDTAGHAWYQIDENGHVDIYGDGVKFRASSAFSSAKDKTLALSVKTVTFHDGVVPATLADWFRGCTNLTTVDGVIPDCESAHRMFANCKKLVSIPNMPELTKQSHGMFYNCSALTSIGKDGKIVIKAQNVYAMFVGCKKLSADVIFDGNPAKLVDDAESYPNIFANAATADGAKITVCFGENANEDTVNAVTAQVESLENPNVTIHDYQKSSENGTNVYTCRVCGDEYTTYDVTLPGEETAEYEEGTELTVSTDGVNGAWFVNGKRIDTLETVENYVVGENNALTITVCEPVESVEWKEFAGNSMVMSSRKKVGNYIKVNLTAKWALPEGAEVVEAGIARVYAEDCPEDFDAQYIYDNGSKKVSSLKTLNGKYSYALSMNSKSAKKTLCAVSFVTYKIGDVTYTDLSDIAVSAEPAADLA